MDILSEYLQEKRKLIDQVIDDYLPNVTDEPRLIHQCMKYSTTDGKRLRPIIVLAVGELFDCPAERLLPTAAAIEFIHTHSLILDDMPCMDNDDYRRDRLANHKVFGESVALLAADALLNLAIALLGSNHRMSAVRPDVALDIIREVGESVGTFGMIGAQAADLNFSEFTGRAERLEKIHVGKTAMLFRLSARSAALVAGASVPELISVSSYAENLGLAFQIVDDILDYFNKGDGACQARRIEPNYVAAFGAERSLSIAYEISDKAAESLSMFGSAGKMLRLLAKYNLSRVV